MAYMRNTKLHAQQMARFRAENPFSVTYTLTTSYDNKTSVRTVRGRTQEEAERRRTQEMAAMVRQGNSATL